VFFFGALVVMVILHWVAPLVQWAASPWRLVGGGAFIVAGAVLNIWADNLFKRAGTTVKPFEASTALIVDGPFALSRHPMYVGMVLILAGAALALGSLGPWIVVPLFVWQIRRRFVLPEEAKLEASFGERYVDYKRKTRRWL
jgi:protein-S-isoprenylcysteine O-methyltransferase Ste14